MAKKATSRKTSTGRAKKAAPTGAKKKAAKKAVKKTVKKVAKKTVKKATKKSAAKTAKKTVKKVAKKTVKKAAKKSAAKTAKKPVKKVAKTAARPAAKAIKTAKKPKKSLTRKQMTSYRVMLLTKRRALVGDLNGIQAEAFGGRQNGAGDLSSMPTHPADVGTDNFEQEFTLGLLESERILLGEIDDALLRIQKGTYGTCLGTGEPIGKARLTARPWAKYGIEYARMVEKGLVRPGEDDLISDDED